MSSLMTSPSRAIPSAHQTQDEDELLALLSADTFSLESNRDRALLELSSFLKVSLPGTANNSPTGNLTAAWPIAPHSQTAASTFSSSSSSNSTSSFAYSPPTLHPTPYGTPAQASVGLPRFSEDSTDTRPTSRAPSRTLPAQSQINAFASFPSHVSPAPGSSFDLGGFGAQEFNGCRAPAVSRERGMSRPRAGSLARPMQQATFGEDEISEDDYAMEDDEMEQEQEWQFAHNAATNHGASQQQQH